MYFKPIWVQCNCLQQLFGYYTFSWNSGSVSVEHIFSVSSRIQSKWVYKAPFESYFLFTCFRSWTKEANRWSHCVPRGWWRLSRSKGLIEQQKGATLDEWCWRLCWEITQRTFLSALLCSPFPPPTCSFAHLCVQHVCSCVCSVWSQCQLQVWKMEAASWECYRDQHLHTTHKTGMWKTDSQALALTNSWGVYVESSKDGQLSKGLFPPTLEITNPFLVSTLSCVFHSVRNPNACMSE